MSTPPRSRRGDTGPARPGALGPAVKLVLGAVFVAALAYAITFAVGVVASATVPVAPFVGGLLALFVVVAAFAPGPL